MPHGTCFACEEYSHDNAFNPFATLTRTLNRATPLLSQNHIAAKRRLTQPLGSNQRRIFHIADHGVDPGESSVLYVARSTTDYHRNVLTSGLGDGSKTIQSIGNRGADAHTRGDGPHNAV